MYEYACVYTYVENNEFVILIMMFTVNLFFFYFRVNEKKKIKSKSKVTVISIIFTDKKRYNINGVK